MSYWKKIEVLIIQFFRMMGVYLLNFCFVIELDFLLVLVIFKSKHKIYYLITIEYSIVKTLIKFENYKSQK